MSNQNLRDAQKRKNDEYYTFYEDIEKEIKHYLPELKDKIVYCNCDNPELSNFWKYFVDNFENLKLKKIISTHFNKDGTSSYKLEWSGETVRKNKLKVNMVKTPLKGDGDFRSEECIEILKECDIVITNPPFSLFREYVKTLMQYNKRFLIVGPLNAITYKEVFPYIKNNEIIIGVNEVKKFIVNNEVKAVACFWYTNLMPEKEYIPFLTLKKYDPEKYPKYDNYDAINVDRVKDIPCDYYGVMGVPITFITRYTPTKFNIMGGRKGNDNKDLSYSQIVNVERERERECQESSPILQNTNTEETIGKYEIVDKQNTPIFGGVHLQENYYQEDLESLGRKFLVLSAEKNSYTEDCLLKDYKIIDVINRYSVLNGITKETQGKFLTQVNGVKKFTRLLVQKK